MTLSILLIPPSTFPFLTFFSASFFLSFRPFFLPLFYNLIFLTCRLCLFPFFLPSFLLASSLFRFSATIPPSFRSYLAYIFLPSFLPSFSAFFFPVILSPYLHFVFRTLLISSHPPLVYLLLPFFFHPFLSYPS